MQATNLTRTTAILIVCEYCCVSVSFLSFLSLCVSLFSFVLVSLIAMLHHHLIVRYYQAWIEEDYATVNATTTATATTTTNKHDAQAQLARANSTTTKSYALDDGDDPDDLHQSTQSLRADDDDEGDGSDVDDDKGSDPIPADPTSSLCSFFFFFEA